ncbi:MAG: alpha-L-fucosidase [Tannerella sp.]|jgi:alpha-L-fucosidase|nr:alpha-L-fucosidase [Tannerella sp.]
MKKKFIISLLAVAVSIPLFSQNATVDDPVPLAPKEYRRPEGYDPVPFRYKYTLQDMRDKFSDDVMSLAATEYQKLVETNEKGKWKPTPESIDQHPTPSWFEDLKFGMFVDWGLWSVGAYATKMEHEAMYPDWYEYRMVDDNRPYKDNHISLIPYHHKNWGKDVERGDFIPLFTAEKYDPDWLVKFAYDCGMRYLIPFCKHFSGWCLWPSSYTHMDAGDRMGRDLVKPLVDNCRKRGMKFGFYYCTQEWEYPLIADDGSYRFRTWFRGNTNLVEYDPAADPATPQAKTSLKDWENIIPGKVPVRDFLKDYLIPQAVEFIDRYDPDIVWYDGEWTSSVHELGSYEITAYLYNHAEGRKEVAVNDRLGRDDNNKQMRHRRGDIYSSEYGYGSGYRNLKNHAWEENRGISQSFGFNWEDTEKNVITDEELVKMFVEVVSHGGNLLLIVNLDGKGALPKIQEERLRTIGKWLKINGEGIYGTRKYSTIKEENIRYTRTKDNRTVFAHTLGWPGKQLQLKAVKPAEGSKVYLLGYKKPLQWSHRDGVTTITLPDELQTPKKRPCEYAYSFKITP